MAHHTIGIDFLIASQVHRVLDGIIHRLRLIHAEAKAANQASAALFNGMTSAITAGARGMAFLGGAGVAGAGVVGLGALGNEFTNLLKQMRLVGASEAEVLKARDNAWKEHAKNQNMSVTEILRLYSQARQIFAREGHDFGHVIEEMSPFIKAGSFLKAWDGHGLQGDGLHAMIRSAEFAGMIKPEDAAAHVAALVGMKIAFAGKYTEHDYLRDQQAAGVSLRQTGPEFRYGMFPAISQIMSGGGVSLMTLWQKLGAGTRMTRQSLDAMVELGLIGKDNLTGGRTPRIKDISAMKDHSKFMDNPARWIAETLVPLMENKFGSFINALQNPEMQKRMGEADWKDKTWEELIPTMPPGSRETLDKVTAFIGKLFGDRNAMKAIVEMMSMWPKLQQDAVNVLTATKGYLNGGDEYLQNSFIFQKQRFSGEFASLMTALGGPNVGPATLVLKTMADAFSSMGKAVQGMSPETLKGLSAALMGIATGLATMATISVGLAGAALLFTPGGLVFAAVSALSALVYLNWDTLSSGAKKVVDALRGWGVIDAAASALSRLIGILKGLVGIGSGPGTGPGVGVPGEVAPGVGVDGIPLYKQNFVPGPSQGQLIQTRTAIYLDGRAVADAVALHIARAAAHSTGPSGYDMRAGPTPVDGLAI